MFSQVHDRVHLNHILPIESKRHFENIRVISGEELQLMNALTLKDVLNFELLFGIEYGSNQGYAVSNQGLSQRYIKILRNGVPVYPELFNEIQPEQISVVGLDRIEILLAPGGIYNGSGAIGCVINLITESFVTDTTYTAIKGTMSNALSIQNHLNMRFSKTRHSLNFTLGRNFHAGFQGNDSGRVMQFSPFEQLNYHIDYDFRLTAGTNLRISRNWMQYLSVNKSYPLGYSTRAYDLEHQQNTAQNTIKFYGKASKVHQFELGLNHNTVRDERLTYRRDLNTLDRFYEPVSSPFDSINLSETAVWGKIARENPSFQLNYDAGIGMRFTKDQNRQFINGIRTTTTQYFAYARAFYLPAKEITIGGGIKWLSSNHFTPIILPELKLKYQVSPDFRISLGFYSSYRVPDFGELHYSRYLTAYNGVINGNLNLNPEKSQALFTGFEFRKANWYAMSSFQLNRITNVVLPGIQLSDSNYLWSNPGRRRSLSNTLIAGYHGDKVSSQAGLAIVGTNPISHQIDQFRFYPQFSHRLIARIQNIRLAIFNQFTGESERYVLLSSGELALQQNESYWLTDINLTSTVQQWQVQFGINNLWNRFDGVQLLQKISPDQPFEARTIQQKTFYSPGRRAYISLQYTW